jgi:hypothetical protein
VTDRKTLDARAVKLGLRVEKGPGGHRLVDAATGTLVAADWSTLDGFGLSLGDVEQIIAAHSG